MSLAISCSLTVALSTANQLGVCIAIPFGLGQSKALGPGSPLLSQAAGVPGAELALLARGLLQGTSQHLPGFLVRSSLCCPLSGLGVCGGASHLSLAFFWSWGFLDSLPFFFFLNFDAFGCFPCMCVYVPQTHSAHRSQKRAPSSWTGVVRVVGAAMGCWELDPGPQKVLLSRPSNPSFTS